MTEYREVLELIFLTSLVICGSAFVLSTACIALCGAYKFVKGL